MGEPLTLLNGIGLGLLSYLRRIQAVLLDKTNTAMVYLETFSGFVVR